MEKDKRIGMRGMARKYTQSQEEQIAKNLPVIPEIVRREVLQEILPKMIHMTYMITMIRMNLRMNGARNSETVVMRMDMMMRMIIGKKRWIRKYSEE